MNNIVKFGIVVAAGVIVLGAQKAHAQSNIMRMDVGGAGSTTHIMGTVFGKMFSRATGVSIQVNDGQTLTRSGLKLGRGQLEMMPMPPAIYEFMSKGSRMYKKRSHKQAIAASKEVRGILGYLANLFHPVTFESTGIKTWQDIKGKRIFTGPPSGAAAVTTEQMIRVITGFEPNKEYNAIRLPWGGGLQAMLDGKIDVYVRPAGLGSALIEQLGLKKKFRLLDAGDAAKSAAWKKKYLGVPGRTTGVIPKGTYQGQLGGDVTTGGGIFTFVVGRKLSEEMVYNFTKSIWDNLDEIHKTAKILKPLSLKNPFLGMNMPLHAGAIRYYKEKGLTIPSHLM